MALMSNSRLLLLSTVAFIRTILDAKQFNSVEIVDQFPESSFIVLPGNSTGKTGEVVLPALSLGLSSGSSGSPLGLGESQRYFGADFAIELYALKKGQALDIRGIIHEALEDNSPFLYDYNETGYPGNASSIGRIEFSKIASYPISNLDIPALRYGGFLSFLATGVRSIELLGQ